MSQFDKQVKVKKVSKKKEDISVKDAKIWVDALRSGRYKQTQAALNDKKGYCCLGVACDLFIPPAYISRNEQGFIDGYMPDDQPHAPKWLKSINDNAEKKLGIALAELNDGGSGHPDREGLMRRRTFADIADYIEAAYITKVLDK